jgi:hypothetical protein
MRNLEIIELNEVHGGGLATRWAVKLGELISTGLTLLDASSRIDFDASSYGPVDAGGINVMGDYTSGICLR